MVQGFQSASRYLYDAADGQRFFEKVRVCDRGEYWSDADYRIHASNQQWPEANVGGLTQSGNELGLTEAEVDALPAEELDRRLKEFEGRYREAGAHYVVKGIWDCLDVVDDISRRLENGDGPRSA